jgi:receptor protein-tyrosine kinase
MDLIQRAAERLKRNGNLSLVERAAERLNPASPAENADAPAPAATPAAAAPVEAAPEPVVISVADSAADTDQEIIGAVAAPPAPEAALAAAAAAPASDGVPGKSSRHLNLDLGRLQIAGFVTPTGSRTRISEEFRVIKRPVLLRAFATGDEHIEHGNLMMVTSAKPGEGKTFTAINLAMSIASERDLHVLLVDADVQRPSIFQVLGLPPQKGLLDVLSDSSMTPGDVLIRTNIRNLSLMSAGTPSLATTELLASHKMITLMQEISTRYHDRIIILDAPPVLASSEPSVLAIHVGQILLVVEAGKTGRRAVEQSLTHISACPNISIIFNKADATRGKDEFGGYGYGYYETNE